MTLHRGLLILALLAVSGCGNDPETSQGTALAKGFLAKAKSAAPAQTPLTRAVLDQVETPVMVARLETRQVFALIAKIEDNGAVETWSTLDDITISQSDGVIVATRGLGGDLMSARVPAVFALRNDGGRHDRMHSFLDGEDQPVQRRFTCSVSALGAETIEIVEVKFSTRHFVENCSGEGVAFRNDHWFDADGTLRKSRQWIGEDVGYLVLENPRRR